LSEWVGRLGWWGYVRLGGWNAFFVCWLLLFQL
jgi:hypothetical protein